jgi:carbonic anhydrase/acetyltransferase-like protein (isoleucine patch superfamily)
MPVVSILGDGKHAEVLAETLMATGMGNRILGKDEAPGDDDWLIVGIGMDRRRVFQEHYRTRFVNAYHPTAFVAASAKMGVGNHVEAHAYVGPHVIIQDNVLINSGAHISHHTVIEDHAVVAPGVMICGNCRIGRSCVIGAGAIIVQEVNLPDETRIPAGALVVGLDDIRKPVRVADNIRAYEATSGTAASKVVAISDHLGTDPDA